MGRKTGEENPRGGEWRSPEGDECDGKESSVERLKMGREAWKEAGEKAQENVTEWVLSLAERWGG